VEEAGEEIVGRAAHQGPEVDGSVYLTTTDRLERGDLVEAVVYDSDGIDLLATMTVDPHVAKPQEFKSP
jgi:ribosomal protein S12 methylthiotransferase